MGELQTARPSSFPSSIMALIMGAALRSTNTPAYFAFTIEALRDSGRYDDAQAVTYMRELHAMREIEILMTLRAQWLGRR